MTDNTIGAVRTMFQILEALMERETAGVTELATLLDLPKSTVYSHLHTLREEGYVRVDDDKYRLGLRFLEFGECTRQTLEIYDIARPELDDLAEETGELVNLAVEEHYEGVYIYLTRGENAIRLDTYPGLRVPLYCTALGKVSLAHMVSERRERCINGCSFEPLTQNTITDAATLREELDQIRERGYAFDRGERAQDLRCVAAPIVIDDEYTGAISVTGPVSRMRGGRLTEEIPERVVDTASVIQINTTYA